MKEFNLNVRPEICCEECYDVIHNHIDCPICFENDSPTEDYYDLTYYDELTCSNCKSIFIKISDNWYFDCLVKLKINE